MRYHTLSGATTITILTLFSLHPRITSTLSHDALPGVSGSPIAPPLTRHSTMRSMRSGPAISSGVSRATRSILLQHQTQPHQQRLMCRKGLAQEWNATCNASKRTGRSLRAYLPRRCPRRHARRYAQLSPSCAINWKHTFSNLTSEVLRAILTFSQEV